MADKTSLKLQLADAQAALKDAEAALEALRKRYGLAAAVDPEAAEKLRAAEERVKKLRAECEAREKALAEAEAEEARRKAQEAEERARRKAEAEKELPSAAREYRKALEALAARITEARARIAEIADPVLEAEVAAYRAHERVRSLARQAENEVGAQELLSAVLRDLAWPERLPRDQAEDLERFAKLLTGEVGWPERSVKFSAPVPPRVRRAVQAEVQARLRALYEEHLRRLQQRRAGG